MADRPPSARPAPPRPPLRRGPESTPAYDQIPRWGLIDPPPATPDDRAPDDPVAVLPRVLRLVAWTFAVAALGHLIRYAVVVVNRSVPVSAWLDLVSSTLAVVVGVAAIGAMIVGLIGFARWLLTVRARVYRAAGLRDERPRWQTLALAVVPLLNVVGAPIVLTEAALCTSTVVRTRERITRIAVAWGLVTLVALIALAYRIGAAVSDRLQVSGDALAMVTLTFAVSALFAHWASSRLPALFDDVETDREPARRLVVA
ncbi:DUF4328 domain-containing protein [Gordonia shandongensis]|uniref:DUF4328 domain-containing protein n=1 Tax=Gordonia shandongensis TaxID=376351 RepID=UPI000410DC81|nr:DUF4328 domain-containing protein [Gordonia shandongensis]